MLDAMRHRGPDGRGTLEFAGGAAGMVRLALVDLSPRGQQPFWSADRRVAILFNGEIYNFREERDRLAKGDFRFRSTTDTEVVLNLYLERRMEFVHRLRGMYGLAIFDWRESAPGGPPVMTLVRGPLGVKPLYVAQEAGESGQVAFSSEIRSLVRAGVVRPEIDREALTEYLTHGFVLQPRTMISGVRMIEPGSWERYAPGKPVHKERFWRIPQPTPRQETLDEAAERLRFVLEESVALHALADAPVGAFLSGGIDSSGIVGLMRKRVSKLHTYTLRFPEFAGQDESDFAVQTARKLECENTIVDVTAQDVRALLPQFADEIDQPSADGLNTWLISRCAAHDVKAVLSGLGGDEMFAGYPVTARMQRYSNTRLGRAQAKFGGAANFFRNLLPPGSLRKRVDNLATRRSPLATWLQAHEVFGYKLAHRLTGVSAAAGGQQAQFIGILDHIETGWLGESAVGLSCLLDTRVYMINQLLRDADAASMAHSLELRVPLVDLEVLGFARSCDDRFKLSATGGNSRQYEVSGAKRVLIQALQDVLPEDITRRPKRGFELPFNRWLTGELADLVEDTCGHESLRRRGLVNPDVMRELRSLGSGQPLYPHIWSIMILELWCRAVLDSPLSQARSIPVSASIK